MRILKPPSQKNTHLTPKARGPNSNRPKTRQQKRKRKSNRGRRKRRVRWSDGNGTCGIREKENKKFLILIG